VLANTFLLKHFAHEAAAEGEELILGASKIRGHAGDPAEEMYAISEMSGRFKTHQMWGIWWALTHLGNRGLPDVYINDKMVWVKLNCLSV
jgi:hypothetical protein